MAKENNLAIRVTHFKSTLKYDQIQRLKWLG